MAFDNSKPKMLREDSRNIEMPCAAAYYTVEAILRKNALHPTPLKTTYKDTLAMISDTILDNKHKLIDTLDKILKDLMIKTIRK